MDIDVDSHFLLLRLEHVIFSVGCNGPVNFKSSLNNLSELCYFHILPYDCGDISVPNFLLFWIISSGFHPLISGVEDLLSIT